jgi:hypothetical protein
MEGRTRFPSSHGGAVPSISYGHTAGVNLLPGSGVPIHRLSHTRLITLFVPELSRNSLLA